MCGIVGSTQESDKYIKDVLLSMKQRGPDAQKVRSNEFVTFGQCRLSIIDLSEKGSQPMVSADGAVTIVFNGEIYNYEALRRELMLQGVKFVSQSDTEVLLQGYILHGTKFFTKIRGMWAFAIHDGNKNEVILSRDQFGIKPLYYSIQNNILYFSSEMRSFKQWGLSLTPNTSAYHTFFNLGYFISPQTCYAEVQTLSPKTILTFDLDTAEYHFYPLTSEVSSECKFDPNVSLAENLQAVLLESVKAHFVSDVPVGILFSGGNDSSLIAALAREAGFVPQGFHLSVDGSTDTQYAKKIDTHLGLKVEYIDMTESELIEQYEAIWDSLDVPFADISVIPTSLIYKKIAGHTKVVLSGEGGDEYFGGYLRHQKLMYANSSQLHDPVVRILQSMYGTSQGSLQKWNPALSRLRNAYTSYINKDVISMYLAQTKLIDYPICNNDMRAELMRVVEENADTPLGLLFDKHVYLGSNLLYKNDIASMMSSIEARVPLVDTIVYRFISENVPVDRQLSPQYGNKYLLKKILEMYLPDDLVYRDKKGFGFSFNRYNVPAFVSDVEKAIKFHHKNAKIFGLQEQKSLLHIKNTTILIKKYPRFAFALVSNMNVFKDVM